MAKLDALKCDWDALKAESNFKKHSVSFEEACTTFRDPLATIVHDMEHGEERYLLIGLSEFGRLLLTVFREDNDIIWIISSRRVSKKERRIYETEV